MNRFVSLLLGLLFVGTASAQTTHVVTVENFSFTPANLTIEAGDTVRWENIQGTHNVNGTQATFPDNPLSFGNAVAVAPWTYEFTFQFAGDYDYLCDVHALSMQGTVTVNAASTSSPLIISEYVEGSSFNKALEFYNPSDSAVDLDAGSYSVQIYFNGNTEPGATIPLTGSIAPGDVFVLAEDSADPAILAVADQVSGSLSFNGDDAVVLFQGNAAVDGIGQVGVDPGTEWGTGDASTQNNTLRREGTSCTADADPLDEFDPAAAYTGFPNDTFDGLGSPGDLDCSGGVTCEAKFTSADLAYDAGTRRLSVTGGVRNNGADPVPLRLELRYNRDGGNPQGTRVLANGTLPGGASAPINITLNVPAAAPDGTYNFTLALVDTGSGADCATYVEAVAI
ncbi:MAG: lamin tail domain-containing protein, partial [Rubricoccaceae bacterium]|nr:lamin tail domain-containing protein [Rubricoccaceae bacterium]